jgi:hypothetical protein
LLTYRGPHGRNQFCFATRLATRLLKPRDQIKRAKMVCPNALLPNLGTACPFTVIGTYEFSAIGGGTFYGIIALAAASIRAGAAAGRGRRYADGLAPELPLLVTVSHQTPRSISRRPLLAEFRATWSMETE